MALSTILGPNGQPFQKGPPQFSPEFWQGGKGGVTVSVDDVTGRSYAYHPWTYACVRAITLNLARLSYELSKDGESVENHPLLDLLRRPNPMMTWMTFKQAVIINLLLNTGESGGGFSRSSKVGSGGQCFIIPWSKAGKVNLHKGQMPEQLIPLSGTYFTPLYQKGASESLKELVGWGFRSKGDGKYEIEFTTEEIINVYLYNPYDMVRGLAPALAAQLALDQDVRSDIFNSRLFENDGLVSGILSSDEDIDEIQAQQMEQRWMQAYGGAGNRNKIAVIGAGVKFQAIALAKADMQWTEGKSWNKDQILSAYGLNKIAVGDYEQINFATIREGRKLLWHDTYLPLDKMFWDALNSQWICHIEGGRLKLRSDYSSVEPLQNTFKDSSVSGGVFVRQWGFPPELAARIVGVPLTAEDLKRWPHLSEPPPTGGGMPVGIMAADKAPSASPVVSVKGFAVPETEEERERYVDDYIEKVLRENETNMHRDMRRFFVRQRNGMQDKVDAWLKTQKIWNVKSEFVAAETFLFDVLSANEELRKVYKPNVKRQMEKEYQRLVDELGELIAWDLTDPRIDQYVLRRQVIMDEINTNTFTHARDAIKSTVEQGMREGWTVNELATKLKQSIYDVSQLRINNSQTIARTEMGTIASMERFEAFEAEGIEQHKWTTARDDKVRQDRYNHKLLDNKTQAIGLLFEGSTVRYPRDPSGDLGDIINCRCVAVAVG